MNNNLLATIIAFYLSKFNDLALKKLGYMGHRTKRFFQWSGKMGERF